jgi:2-polyprenyl-3-methyl-5-hydroxy-6-metoxy-1,4-benzoquinol methylase
MTETKPHLTAISRKTLPVPTRWLIDNLLLAGDVLDYGCGRCADINFKNLAKVKEVTSIWNYDPHFAPTRPTKKFDRIICNYVLCVVPEHEERHILQDIQNFLKWHEGVAFISVRNDVPRQGYGISSKKTLQRKVELNLPIFHTCRSFKMYMLNTCHKI